MTTDQRYYATSRTKLLVLHVATFGLYRFYWYYQNWKLVERTEKKGISPFWRTVFFPFYAQGLFYRMKRDASERGIANRWSANLLSLAVFLLVIAEQGAASFGGGARVRWPGLTLAYLEPDYTYGVAYIVALLFMIVSVVPMYRVQATANEINGGEVRWGGVSLGEGVVLVWAVMCWISVSWKIALHFVA